MGKLPALEEITWHVGCGALMSTTDVQNLEEFGLLMTSRPGLSCSFGSLCFWGAAKGKGAGGEEHLPLRWFLLLQVLRGPQGSIWLLFVPWLVPPQAWLLSQLSCPGDALTQEELSLREDWGHWGGERSPCPVQSPLGFETPYLHGQALNAVQEQGLEKLGEVLKELVEMRTWS